MQAHWWLDTKDKPALLWAFMRHFVDRGTVSIEGDLEDLQLDLIPGASSTPTSILSRRTVEPVRDFFTIPINEATIRVLRHVFMQPGLFSDAGVILHLQIEHEGALVFGAYDNFRRECVIANPPTPESLLIELKARGTLRDFRDEPKPLP